jgi:hypothetical protein
MSNRLSYAIQPDLHSVEKDTRQENSGFIQMFEASTYICYLALTLEREVFHAQFLASKQGASESGHTGLQLLIAIV